MNDASYEGERKSSGRRTTVEKAAAEEKKI